MPTYTSLSALTAKMREQITGSDAQAVKAMLRIYEFQTSGEQVSHSTHCMNGEGFNKSDARILSSMCDFYKRKGFLSQKQMRLVKARIGKYAGQLVKHSLDAGMIAKVGNSYVAGDKEISKARIRQEILED